MPRNPKFIGSASVACSISSMCREPGVQVVALVPVAGPVPPPMNVVTPLASASYTCCGQMKWMCESMPPAVRISPSPAMASVVTPTTMSGGHAGHHVGIAGLADAGDAPALDADVRLADAGPVDDERVGDDAVERAASSETPARLAHAVAQHLAAAELALVAVDGGVVLDLRDEIGVAEAHAIAGRRAVDVGVVASIDSMTHSLTGGLRPAGPPSAVARGAPSPHSAPAGAPAARYAIVTGGFAPPAPQRADARPYPLLSPN